MVVIDPNRIDAAVIARKLAAGRGQGSGSLYNPWLHVGEVRSHGRSHRIFGWQQRRVHHFLSDHELRCFYIYWWSGKYSDTREQFPLLPIQKTLDIAARLNIEHPANPKTRKYTVMTSDFCLTIQRSEERIDIIRTFKEEQELRAERVQEKLLIEQCFWQEQEVPRSWGIVTDRDFPLTRAKNIERIYKSYDSAEFQQAHRLSDMKLRAVVKTLTPSVQRGDTALNEAALMCDERLGLSYGASLAVAYHCIATRQWPVDMDVPINPDKPLTFS